MFLKILMIFFVFNIVLMIIVAIIFTNLQIFIYFKQEDATLQFALCSRIWLKCVRILIDLDF